MLPVARFREASPRTKRPNSSGRSFSGIPGPSSRTRAMTWPSFGADSSTVTWVPAGRVHAGVRQQVGEHLLQARPVAAHDDRLLGQLHAPLVVAARDVRVPDDVDEQAREVDVAGLELALGVQPGEQQEVLDEARHPHRLGLDAADVVLHVLAEVAAEAARQLRVPADGGERGPQLVARVRDEVPHLLLARLPDGERATRRSRGGCSARSRPGRPRCAGWCRARARAPAAPRPRARAAGTRRSTRPPRPGGAAGAPAR